MKPLRTLLAIGIVLSVVGVALCQESGQPARPARARPTVGTLVKVDGTNLLLSVGRGEEAKEVTVATTETTQFIVDAEAGKLADLKPGMRITAMQMPATETRPARSVITADSPGVSGTLVRVDGTNVVLRVGRGEEAKEATVVTDEKTRVVLAGGFRGGAMQPAKVGTLADLKAGMRVTAIPETGTATKIIARTVRERPTTRRAQ